MQAEISKIVLTRLKEARKARRITLRSLAEAVGYKASTISGVENGKTEPSDRLIDALITELGVNEEWLWRGSGGMFLSQGIVEAKASKQRVQEAARRAKALVQSKGRSITWSDPGPQGGEKMLSFAQATQSQWALLVAQLGAAQRVIASQEAHNPASDESSGPVYVASDSIIHMPREIVLKPALGGVAAGFPQEAIEETEQWVAVPKTISKEVSYALKVQGDSMVDRGIQHGDIVLVNASAQPQNGSFVVAVVDGETTLKRYVAGKGSRAPFLESANKAFPPKIVPREELIIRGVVIAKLDGGRVTRL